MKSSAKTVNATATLVVSQEDKNRYVYLHNGGGAKIYLGGSDVTVANGYHLANNESVELFVPVNETVYGVVASGTNIVTLLTPNPD